MYDPVLTSSYKVFQSVETLGRLTRLNNCLVTSNFMRSRALNALQELWKNALEDLKLKVPFEVVYKTMKKEIKLITTGVKKDKNLWGIYKKVLRNTPISKLLKDTYSLQTFFLQKTNKGQNGPTHLVSYTRSSKKADQTYVRSYVIKWTNWNEVCSWRFFEAFSKQNWTVPKTSTIDFDLPEQAHLKQPFLDVVGKSIQVNDSKLMLMEKVKGSNLVDFAQTKYRYLNIEEKCHLFQKMGHLAMLDLLFGNTDRLVQTRFDGKKYQLENLTANLGNLMIAWMKDEGNLPELYAIDNGMKTELVSDKAQKNAYNDFILTQCTNPAHLADTIISSIQKSFEDIAEQMSEDSGKTLKESLATFQFILDDLKELKPALTKGLGEMASNFQKVLLPFWNSGDALNLKNNLKDLYPEMLDAVVERFQKFNLEGHIMQFNYEALQHWLTAMETYSVDGSYESREAVIKLSKDLPDSESMPEDVREVLVKIKKLAESKDWDPTLSPNSKKVLKRVSHGSSAKPSCLKKLDF